MIITGPGVKGTRIVDSFAYVTDIMPTLLEYANVEHPQKYQGRRVEKMRGRSLIDVASGAKDNAYAKDELIGAEMMGGKWMRKGDYKATLIPSEGMGFGSGTWKLFNVKEDPGETRDLSALEPDMLQELTEAWDSYANDVGILLSK